MFVGKVVSGAAHAKLVGLFFDWVVLVCDLVPPSLRGLLFEMLHFSGGGFVCVFFADRAW